MNKDAFNNGFISLKGKKYISLDALKESIYIYVTNRECIESHFLTYYNSIEHFFKSIENKEN